MFFFKLGREDRLLFWEEERWNDGDKREYLPHLSPLYMYDNYYKNISILIVAFLISLIVK